MSDLKSLFEEVNNWITPSLEAVFSADEIDANDITVKASLYSLLAGGKRIRPTYMYCSAKLLNLDLSAALPYATALEMIHTYSLIHDDLPSMDNDDLRRGKPTCHKVYGEGIALLAGDNLLNRAHEILLQSVVNNPKYAMASYKISYLAGICGMIGGQSIDLSSEGKQITLDTLYELQRKKTGALLKAAICTPYYLAENCSLEVLNLLSDYSEHIGLAFQIKDDILDVESNSENLGKSVGKDERDNKATFVTLLGIDEAKKKLDEEISGCYKSLQEISKMGYNVSDFEMLTRFMLERNY